VLPPPSQSLAHWAIISFVLPPPSQSLAHWAHNLLFSL
jgi:hypothetical protein